MIEPTAIFTGASPSLGKRSPRCAKSAGAVDPVGFIRDLKENTSDLLCRPVFEGRRQPKENRHTKKQHVRHALLLRFGGALGIRQSQGLRSPFADRREFGCAGGSAPCSSRRKCRWRARLPRSGRICVPPWACRRRAEARCKSQRRRECRSPGAGVHTVAAFGARDHGTSFNSSTTFGWFPASLFEGNKIGHVRGVVQHLLQGGHARKHGHDPGSKPRSARPRKRRRHLGRQP